MAALGRIRGCSPLLLLALVIGLLSATHGGAMAVNEQASSSATPVSKVIQLLEDLHAKGEKEKQDEATRFSAFSQWCGDQTRIKTDEIEAGTENIDMLAAKIEKDAALIRSLTDRIQELEEDIARWAKDTKSASVVRAKETADYKATSADYSESLEALDGAIKVLQEKQNKVAQAEVLLQVSRSRLVPDASKRVLTAFLQESQTDEALPDKRLFNDAPEAYGYESQSGGVVEMLEKLKDEFEKKKYELDKEEMKAQHAFEDIAQQLKDNTENAQHEVDKKTNLRADTQKNKAGREGEKAQAEADRAEDEKYLDEMKGMCAQKQQDFTTRQKLRAEELDAVQEAIDIMSSDDVSGSANKHLPSFLSAGDSRSASLAQLRKSGSHNPLQAKVSAFLAERSERYNSKVLALASQQVSADPFEKVKKMIFHMISTLEQEATAETEHKGWCDAELGTNKQTRDQKTASVEELTAEKEDLTSLIAKLTQDIGDLTAAVKELDVSMAETTAERTTSKEKNEQTIKDAKAAQKAVEQAMAVLKDFYAKAADATALAQTAQSPAEDAPETFDKPYKGLTGESGGVVGFMEVILTDFTRLESDTASSEAAEQDEYEKFTFESKKDKTLKENDIGHKSSKKSDSEDALAKTEEELKLTQSQLDKAVQYYEKLKPTCVDTGMTHEERVRRREEEIQSLQEALQILKGTDLS